jgi:hypothetical protein
MRAARLISALVALALLGLVPASTSASAVPTDSARTSGAADRPARAAAGAAEITITSRVVVRKKPGQRKRKLFLVGRVEPAQGPVFVQMAKRCNKEPFRCNFKFYKRGYLKNGRYMVRITASPTHRSYLWRARIGDATSPIWRTCVEEPCRLPFPKEDEKD